VEPRIKKIEEEVIQLSSKERALLATHLIHSLDDEEDPEAENAWIEEAEHRYNEYKQGKVTGKPAEEVLKEIRAKFE